MIGKNTHFIRRKINISFITGLNTGHLLTKGNIRSYGRLSGCNRSQADGVMYHNRIHPFHNQRRYMLRMHGKRYQTGITITIRVAHPYFNIVHPCRIRHLSPIMDARQSMVSLTQHGVGSNLLQSRSCTQSPTPAIHQIALGAVEHNGRKRQRITGILRSK